MNLIIDIGNTCAKLAIFDKDELIDFTQTSNQSLAVLPLFIKKYPFLSHGIIATVITLNEEIERQLEALPFPLLKLNHQTPIPISNLYRSPQTLGPDRLAAAIGAQGQKPRKDILIIDAGTALTYEFIDRHGSYHGGNISPGISMRLKSLHEYTDKLPLVSASGITPIIGYDTETAIRSGVIHGMEMEIKGYIELMQEKYPGLLVFLTGGDDFSFDTNLKSIIFADRFLVLKGLNRILRYNEHL